MSGPGTTQYQRALDYVSTDFDEADPVRRAVLNIAAFLFERPAEERRHLTFGMLRRAAQLREDEGEILHRAIAYMTGDRAKLLLLMYEFIDGDFHYPLDEGETKDFLATGKFYDPRNGMLVPDSGNFIYIFFRPNYAAFH